MLRRLIREDYVSKVGKQLTRASFQCMDEKQIEKKVTCSRGSFLDVEKVDRLCLDLMYIRKKDWQDRYIFRNYKSN